jgi:hypothetical protein
MKKIILSCGAIATLALSSIALASCGGASEVEIKDLNGETYKISQTEDTEAVSKALVLASKNALSEDQEKLYAIEADLALDGKINVSGFNGLNFNIELNANGKAGVSIGTHQYQGHSMQVEPSEEDMFRAEEELLNNLKFLAEGSASLKFTDISLDEKSSLYDGLSDEIMQKDREAVQKIKGKSLTANARVFMYEGYGYTEVDSATPKELLFSPTSGEYLENLQNEFHMHEKADMHNMGYSSVVATSLLHDYQTMTLTELLEADGSYIPNYLKYLGIPFNMEDAKSLLSMGNIDESFYESDSYKMIKAVVETIGISISKVENDNITFALDLNEKEIPALAKKLGLKESLGISNLDSLLSVMFNNDNSLLNLSFSMNAKTGRLTNVTLNLERVDRIITAVKLAVPT